MSQGRTRASHPALTESDAWLFAALTERPHPDRPVNLRDFVDNADWLNRAIPTFDEMSFGLPRLAAAGLLVVEQDANEGLVLRATTKAIKLRRLMKAKALGDDLQDIDEAIRAAAHPEPERVEDRSLGRLPGLGADDLDAAIREHGERIEELSKPYIAIAQGAIRRQKRKP
jgi:hypothetical protein